MGRVPGRKPTPPMQRYLAKIDRSDIDGCWPWTGPRRLNRKGELDYGLFMTSRVYEGVEKTVSAHRWGYEHLVGTIPPGLQIGHTCDNPPCQRPDHWFLCTNDENQADKIAKGRQASKLTVPQVLQIRAMWATGRWTKKGIARSFGVDSRTVRSIISREWWRHV